MIVTIGKFMREKNTMPHTPFTDEQARELMAISDSAYIQMLYYVSLSARHSNQINMEDDYVAYKLGKSEQAVKRTRLALTKAGWFLRSKHTDSNGVLHVQYFVGKDSVNMTQKQKSIKSVVNSIGNTTRRISKRNQL